MTNPVPTTEAEAAAATGQVYQITFEASGTVGRGTAPEDPEELSP